MNAETLVITDSFRKNIPYIICMLAGLVPVSCIALHVLGFLPLSKSVFLIVLPAFTLTLLTAMNSAYTAKLMLQGWITGVIAVTLYDLSRIPFILAGWNDFVPHIGDWLLEEEDVNPLLGYVWRYAGNGGGLGITFIFFLKLLDKKANLLNGIFFGLFVFSSLMLSLIIAPEGEFLMFPITLFTFTGSLVGHVIYGAVVGMTESVFRHFYSK